MLVWLQNRQAEDYSTIFSTTVQPKTFDGETFHILLFHGFWSTYKNFILEIVCPTVYCKQKLLRAKTFTICGVQS